MKTPTELLLERLTNANKTKNGWSALCPAHDDRKASLSVSEGEDGRALIKCHAGCDPSDICDAVGLRLADLMAANGGNGNSELHSRVVAKFDYRDEGGNLLFQVLRYEPKDFRQRKPKLGGGWEWRVKGVRVIPYRLPELLSNPDAVVYVVEGEKDVDSLGGLGLIATCNAMGAGNWTAEHAAFLKGRIVVVLPDNDDAGLNHALAVRQSLSGVAASVKVVQLPGLAEKGDVSDWLTVGGTRERLEEIVSAAPEMDPFGSFGIPSPKHSQDFTPLGCDRQQPEEWPEIDPIDDSLPPVNPFVYDLLPLSLRGWVADIADRMECPPDFVAVSAVTVLATIVGKQVAIRPKAYDDWTVIPNLWALVVGRPSVMKSPAVDEPMRMLRYFEVEERERYEERKKHAMASSILMESQEKLVRAEIAKQQKAKNLDEAERLAMSLVCDEQQAVEPRRRYYTNDSTVEKLQLLCAENPNGLLVFRDEIRGLLSRLDKEEYGHERAFYLEAWNGKTASTVDRVGRGTIECESVVINLLGGIQPDRLRAYVGHAVRGGAGDDGLVQRLQLAVWPDCDREFRNVDRWPDTSAKAAARDLYSRIRDLDVSGARLDEDDQQPYVRFTDDAQNLFNEWRVDLENEVRSGDLPEHLESHLAKYRSLVPSLALLLHLADFPVGDVGREALFTSTRWTTYLRSHAERIYRASIQEAGIQGASAVLAKIRSGHLQDGFTLKDVYHQQWRHLTTREDALAAMTVLTMRNYVRLKRSQGTVGRPSEHYEIHPQFLKSL